MASDSAATEQDGTKQTSTKITVIREALLFGASGDVATIKKVVDSLEDTSQPLNVSSTFNGLRKEIRKRNRTVLAESRQMFVPFRNIDAPPTALSLIVGIYQNKPWILELDATNNDTLYDESMGSFGAVGSGSPFARALFRQFLDAPKPRTRELSKILAYRVMEDSIKIAASGLAEPIHLYEMDLQSRMTQITALDEIRTTVQLWKNMELETLGRLLAPRESTQGIEIPRDE